MPKFVTTCSAAVAGDRRAARGEAARDIFAVSNAGSETGDGTLHGALVAHLHPQRGHPQFRRS